MSTFDHKVVEGFLTGGGRFLELDHWLKPSCPGPFPGRTHA
ncbi:hypothetical protein ACFWA9_14985 [Kitasatospora sp. NPDC059973]